MKERAHLITSSEAGGKRILARVRGPAEPSIATLYRQFRETFGFPDPIDISLLPGADFIARLERKQDALARVAEDTGDGWYLGQAEAFLEALSAGLPFPS